MKAILFPRTSIVRVSLLVASLSLAGAASAWADTQDPPRHKHHHEDQEEEEFHGPAKVFEKVGGFFQRLADHIERSDGPRIYLPPPPPPPPLPPFVHVYTHRDTAPPPPELDPQLSSNYATETPPPPGALPRTPNTQHLVVPPPSDQDGRYGANTDPNAVGPAMPPPVTQRQPLPPSLKSGLTDEPAPKLGKLPDENRSNVEGDTSKASPPAAVPMATRVNKPGRVKLPFPPYNEIDVTGLPSGSLAKDPSSGKVFRVP